LRRRVLVKVSALFSVLFLSLAFFSCMKLLNIQIPDGVYVVGDWNGWVPTEKDRMMKEGDIYTFEIPESSLTFLPSSAGREFLVGKYKVIYKSGGRAVVTSDIYVWKDRFSDGKIKIYTDPSKMMSGQATGVGDSEKENGDWYIAGSFNGWRLEKMTKQDSGVFTLEKDVNLANATIEFKIARSTDWKPYELQFDGKNYNAGYGINARYVSPKTGQVRLLFTFNPRFSVLKCEVK